MPKKTINFKPLGSLKKLLYIIFLLPFLAIAMSSCTNPHSPAGHEGYVFEDRDAVPFDADVIAFDDVRFARF